MIDVKSLSKVFFQHGEEIPILADLEMTVSRGECVIIDGPSGCGKTTLLNIMGCLARPTRGEVIIDRRRTSHLPEHFLCELRRSRIGFIFQQFNLLPGFTALENAALPLAPLGIGSKERRRRAEPLLDFLGLEDRKDFQVTDLSGGEQQRVAIARALMNNPEIILADEPLSNVDALTAERIIGVFRDLLEKGKTMILTDHSPLLARSLPITNAYRLERGRLS